MSEERQEQSSESMANTSSNAVQNGINSVQKSVANATSQKNLKARVFTKLAPMLGPIIFWATVIIIAIVVLVGIGTFLMTTPGIIMDKLEKIAGTVVDALQHYFLGDDLTKNVKEEEILGVLDYLEDMNYDLKGYGFLTTYADEEPKTYEDGKPTGATQYKDGEADGVIRYTKEDEEADPKHKKGDIKEAVSKYVFMYLVSDNYIYTVKNNNLAFRNENGPLGVLASLYVGNFIHIANYASQIIDTFTSFHTAGLTSEIYGNGLINFFYESKFGVKGATFGNDISNQIELDQAKKTIKIKHSDGLFWANKSEMEYKVDGWAGRYGMPLEFLLSVHIATMMPDLACDMVQLFPTEVQTYLHYVSNYSITDDEGNSKKVNTYIPYIARVVNHWYRDVYLVQPEDENTGFVQMDAEYESIVKERWTLYETYTINEALTYGNENLAGEYKLYGLKDNGEYATSVNEVKNHEKAVGKLKIATTEDGHKLVLFVGTIEEANPTLSIMRNNENTNSTGTNAQIESVEDNRIPVAKKAITFKFSDTINTPSEEIVPDNPGEINESEELTGLTDEELEKLAEKEAEQAVKDWQQIEASRNIWDNGSTAKQREMYEDVRHTIEMGTISVDPNMELTDSEAKEKYIKELIGGEIKAGLNASVIRAKVERAVRLDQSDNVVNKDKYTYKIIYLRLSTNPIVFAETGGHQYEASDINDYGWYQTDGVWTAYKLNTGGAITQEGEGLRTETNPIIKQLFTTNTYLRYDGTPDTAEAIQQLKEAYGIGETSLDFYAESKGVDLDEVLNYKTQLLDESGEDKGNPITIDEVSGQVALNQDSLNAFSILENTHTLDSDYIYRDFKELVVELGYFTKEELTESIPRLLAWVVPETGSYGYPFNELDKKVNDFGTLIHSKGDIDVYKKKMLAEAIENSLDDGSDQDEEEKKKKEEETENENLGKLDNTIKDVRKIYGVRDDENLVLRANKNYFLSEEGTTQTSSSSGGLMSLEEWWQSNQEMYDVFKSQSWTYAQDHSCSTFEQAQSSKHTTDCSLMASWALQRLGALQEGNTFCSMMGSSGALDGSAPAQDLINAGADIIAPPSGTKFAPSTTNGTLEPGDILFYDGHVSIFCGPDYENCVDTSCWDAGSTGSIQKGGPAYKGSEGRDIKLIVRLPFGNTKNKGEKYKGYEGNEAVVSPVTGILLEYGTYDSTDKDERVNSDVDCKEIDQDYRLTSTEENYKDKVGYAKIMILDAENYKKLEAGTSSQFKENSLLKPNYNSEGINQKFEEKLENEDELDNWSAIDQTIYGYKEFAEIYEKTKIAGNIIYIDGYKCEDVAEDEEKGPDKVFDGEDIEFSMFDTSEIDIENEEKVRPSLYEDDTEYKDISIKVTERIKAESTVKSNAASSIGINAAGGKLVSNFGGRNRLVFIQEGTVLGRTITDKELMENTEYRNKKLGAYEDVRGDNGKVIGNYLRIIMRNSDDDSIIENVEDYMKLDDGEVDETLGSIEQFMYWQAKEPEGFEYILDGQQSYALAQSHGASRRDNPSDPHKHDYGVDNGGAGDDNLCPGIYVGGGSGKEIFTKVTGITNIQKLQSFATGEQHLDIYTQELEANMKELRDTYPVLETLDDEDTRMFALMDVMYAGCGNFRIGTIDDKLMAGDLNLTREDFLSNCTSENAFYRQNANGFTRRRLADFYMYTEGYFVHDLYDTQGEKFEKRWEFKSETPFQDLMVDIEGAELVDMN